jgi:hypothetical protein
MTGTTINPVNPLTGVTEIPVVVTLILTRDLSSASVLLESERFLAGILTLADCDELIVSALVFSNTPDFGSGINEGVDASEVVSEGNGSR